MQLRSRKRRRVSRGRRRKRIRMIRRISKRTRVRRKKRRPRMNHRPTLTDQMNISIVMRGMKMEEKKLKRNGMGSRTGRIIVLGRHIARMSGIWMVSGFNRTYPKNEGGRRSGRIILPAIQAARVLAARVAIAPFSVRPRF